MPPPDDDDDLALVLRMIDEDRDALRAVVRRYGGKVRGYLRYKFGGSVGEDEIEDALSRTAFKVWSRAGQFDDSRGTLKGWLLRIAYHEMVDLIRGRGEEALGYDLDSRPAATEETTHAQRRICRDVQTVIESLPPLQRAVIEADLLCNGCADAERLADRLGTTRASVTSSRDKAKKKIKEQMRELGHFLSED